MRFTPNVEEGFGVQVDTVTGDSTFFEPESRIDPVAGFALDPETGDTIRGIEPRFSRPDSSPTFRRLNLGRDWIDWTDEEIRYVLGDEGVRIVREDGRAVELWVDEGDDLTRVLGDALRAPGPTR